MTTKSHANETSVKPEAKPVTNGKAEAKRPAATEAPMELSPAVIKLITEAAGEVASKLRQDNADLLGRIKALETQRASDVNADRLRVYLKDETIKVVADKAEQAKTFKEVRAVSARLHDDFMSQLIDCNKLPDNVPRVIHFSTYEIIGVVAVGALAGVAGLYGAHTMGSKSGHKRGMTEGYGHGASDMQQLHALEAANDAEAPVVRTTTTRRRAV
jgi:hypothetical protein